MTGNRSNFDNAIDGGISFALLSIGFTLWTDKSGRRLMTFVGPRSDEEEALRARWAAAAAGWCEVAQALPWAVNGESFKAVHRAYKAIVLKPPVGLSEGEKADLTDELGYLRDAIDTLLDKMESM